MDIEALKVWLQAVNMIGTLALGVWLYLEKRSDKTNDRVSQLAGNVEDISKKIVKITAVCEGCTCDEVAARVGHVENDISGLKASSEIAPNHNDLANVYKAINDLAETVNQLVGENRGQSDQLRMILTQIMKRGL